MSRAEKFIEENTKALTESNGKEYFMWISPDQARRAVEIAREEIYEWLSENFFNYFEARMSMFDMCLEDLKQAMRDE